MNERAHRGHPSERTWLDRIIRNGVADVKRPMRPICHHVVSLCRRGKKTIPERTVYSAGKNLSTVWRLGGGVMSETTTRATVEQVIIVATGIMSR